MALGVKEDEKDGRDREGKVLTSSMKSGDVLQIQGPRGPEEGKRLL